MGDLPGLNSSDELASYLRVPVDTIYRWKTAGTGPRAIRVGKRTYYRTSDVQAWLDEHADDGAVVA
jgi:excisionase family DNA binding protein